MIAQGRREKVEERSSDVRHPRALELLFSLLPFLFPSLIMESLKFGDRVEIGGRTMLRANFSLVGLTGTIFPSGPGTPPGCLTVLVEWEQHGYTEENGYKDGDLPAMVNVPAPHLFLIEANKVNAPVALPKIKASPDAVPPPELHVLPSESAPAPSEEAPGDAPDDEPPRPALRLV